MKKIGIVSCNEWQGKIKEDLFLQQALQEQGVEGEIISWEDQDIDYSKYDALILRSVWGYQHKYKEFKEWLLRIKKENIKLFNNPDQILKNIRKNIQFAYLVNNDIPHIPTIIIKREEDLDTLLETVTTGVIKPIISGSGNNTFLVSDPNLDKEHLKELLQIEDNGLMYQPFIEGIKDGEYACIYISNESSHNMLRFPGIFSEKDKPKYLESIPEEVKRLADRVASLPDYQDALYLRIDIVINNGIPTIMEVELAEPDLLFKYIPDEEIRKDKVTNFAKKLIRRL